MSNIQLGIAKIIVAMVLWGSIGIFVRLAEQPSSVIVLFRVLSAFVVLFFYLHHRGRLFWPRRNQLILLLTSGIVISLNWWLFFRSVQLTSIANAVLSYYMAPVMATIWAAIVLREQITKHSALAMLFALFGILLMLSSQGFSLSNHDSLGILAGLGGAFFYSWVTILVKKLSALPADIIVLFQMGVAALFFMPVVGFNGLAAPSLLSLGTMIAMGVIHTALALVLYFSGLKSVTVQTAGVLSFADPFSAMLFGWMLFAEIPSLPSLVGGALILIAGYLVIQPPSAAKAHDQAA